MRRHGCSGIKLTSARNGLRRFTQEDLRRVEARARVSEIPPDRGPVMDLSYFQKSE